MSDSPLNGSMNKGKSTYPCIQKALLQFNQEQKGKLQHQPYPHAPPSYVQKIQLVPLEDTGPQLDQTQTKYSQEVTGTFLYYTQMINSTMLTTQAKPTTMILLHKEQFLDSMATNSEATLIYQAMI